LCHTVCATSKRDLGNTRTAPIFWNPTVCSGVPPPLKSFLFPRPRCRKRSPLPPPPVETPPTGQPLGVQQTRPFSPPPPLQPNRPNRAIPGIAGDFFSFFFHQLHGRFARLRFFGPPAFCRRTPAFFWYGQSRPKIAGPPYGCGAHPLLGRRRRPPWVAGLPVFFVPRRATPFWRPQPPCPPGPQKAQKQNERPRRGFGSTSNASFWAGFFFHEFFFFTGSGLNQPGNGGRPIPAWPPFV